MKKGQNLLHWKNLDENVIFNAYRKIIVGTDSPKQVAFRLIKGILVKNYRYDLKVNTNKKSILFFYSADYYRKDHVENFKKAFECCDIASVMQGAERGRIFTNISLLNAVRRILKIPALKRWHKSRWGRRESFWRMLPAYFVLEDQWKLLKELDIDAFDALVVYFDAWFTDAALVQLFQTLHKKTATLQHAFFAAETDKSKVIGERGVELECSNADVFLAWNEATVIEAKKQGICENKIKVVGIPRYIGQNTEENSFDGENKQNRFGVILGVKDNEKQNIAMIQIANKIAEHYGMQYYIKYHPAFLGTEYDNYIKAEYCLGNIDKKIDLIKYAQCIDFSIVGNSTVMMELLYLKHKTFHYTDKQLYEKYAEMKEITFSEFQEFQSILQIDCATFELVRERYCGPKDTQQRYIRFFSDFLNS